MALAEKWGPVGSGCAGAPLDRRAETAPPPLIPVSTMGLTHSSHSSSTVHPSKRMLSRSPQIKGKVSQNEKRDLGTELRHRTKPSCSSVSGPGPGVHGVTSLRDKAWLQSCWGPWGFGKRGVWSEGKPEETFAPAKLNRGTFFLFSQEPAPFLVPWFLGFFCIAMA